jgi:class 3 adenylate cyclase/tetratricopeptide (TPR) repeat protein/ribosomal protein L40E
MLCAKCNYDNPADTLFCMKCGSKVENRCASCYTVNPADANFCRKCGGALGADAPASSPNPAAAKTPRVHVTHERQTAEGLEGERKTVTALFADIKGSMELMENLDPEEARRLVDPALKLMMDAVHRYEGYVAQSTGDGIFALFGAPIAHEDHPQRALYSALRMQEDLKRYADRLREQGQPPLLVRVGVNSGEVVVRSIATGDGRVEYTPIGHSISLASRLQTLAAPGSVVIGEGVEKFVEGYFQLRALGASRIKGVAEPIEVFEVTGLGPLRTRLQRAAGGGLTKFVGREREMDALKHAAEQAKQGHGQIVAVMAEAGIGKSRLFFEFKATSQAGWMALETFSVSHGKASAYLPVIDLLRNYFDITGVDDERKRREKVTGRVLALDRSLEDILPYLFSLLGVVEGDDPLAQMSGQIRKRRTLEAIKRILLRKSLNQPLMVIFEDLHWIDEETQALINLLADSIGTAKFLLLVNYRPEYSHQWNNKTYYTQLRLDPLGKESADEMLTALLGDGKDLVPLKRLIIERTEGTPFFMEETVQSFFEDGVLQRNGVVKLVKSMSAVKVPATVRAILASRIDRLPPDEKELLQTLAVIGREFALSLVRRVVDGRKDDELERRLGDLQMAEFIYEQPATGGDIEYIFKHALTQEVAYNSVLVERRRLLHQRTGAALESLYSDWLEDHYAELARHYRQSDDVSKAVEYLRLAAEQSIGRSSYAEAAADLKAAITLVGRLPQGTDRLRAELALHTADGAVALVLHGIGSQERERAFERVCELSERLGDTASLLRGFINLAIVYIPRGEPLRARQMATRYLESAEQAGEMEMLAPAHWIAAHSAHFCGDISEAVSKYREWMARFETVPQGAFPINVWALVPGFCCSALHLLGRASEALKLGQESLDRAGAVKQPFTLGLALTLVAWLHQLRREPEVVRELAEGAIALGDEQGFPEWQAWGQWLHGWAIAELGDIKGGVSEMEAGIAGFLQIGGVPRQAFTVAMLAKGYEKLGRIDEGLAQLDGMLARIERSGERLDEAELYRVKGELLDARGPSAKSQAETCFRKAIEVARQQKSRWWELRATTSLARLLAKQGRREETRTILAEIYGWFTEGFDTADLKDAKALLNDLNG